MPALTHADQVDDVTAIRSVVFDYLEGINTADRGRLEEAFHPDASLKSPGDDGALRVESIGDAIDRWAGYEPQSRDGVIRSLEITRGALARVVFDFDGSYIDYLTLAKLRDRWVIIDKAFVPTP